MTRPVLRPIRVLLRNKSQAVEETNSMTDAPMSPRRATIWTEARHSRSTRRAERVLRHQLEELTSPADRLELSVVLRRHAPDRAAQVRDLLHG
jgi:hypothetical protein